MKTYELTNVLERTSQSIEEFGWTSGGDAYRDGTTSTASRVRELLESDIDATDYSDEEIDGAVDWATSSASESGREYLMKIGDIAKRGTATEKEIGFAVSILPSYRKFKERTELNRLYENSDWVGEEGERTTLDLELISTKELEFSTLCRFLANGKDVVVWFASNPPNEIYDGNAGDVVTLKGTVKRHDEFKDTKQTILTRCKVA